MGVLVWRLDAESWAKCSQGSWFISELIPSTQCNKESLNLDKNPLKLYVTMATVEHQTDLIGTKHRYLQNERDAATWKGTFLDTVLCFLAASGITRRDTLWILLYVMSVWRCRWCYRGDVSTSCLRLWLCICAGLEQFLAALARLDLHVGKLLYFRCLANVVENGEGFQVLGHTARWCWRFGVDSVVQTQHL